MQSHRPFADTFTRIELSSFLDRSPWTGRQKLGLTLIVLVLLFDGLDNFTMGIATPTIAREWGTTPSAFGLVFALGLVGLAVGSILAGPLSDRFGRKRILLGSLIFFALTTLASVLSSSPQELAVLRFLAGLGFGGAVPAATALVAELTPLRRRTYAVTLGIIAIPLGAVVGSALAGQLLPTLGWRWLFGMCGAAPIVLAPLLMWGIPESPHFIVAAGRGDERVRGAVRNLGLKVPDDHLFETAPAAAARGHFVDLFLNGRARDTVALCLAFVSTLSSTYFMLNWLPSVLAADGLGTKYIGQSMLAYNVGGIVASLICASLVNHFGSRVLIVLGMLAVFFSAYLAVGPKLSTQDSVTLMALLALQGGSIASLNTPLYALAANTFPTAIRTTGVATGLFCGRVGGIASAFAGGAVLTLSNGPRAFFTTNALIIALVVVSLAAFKRHIEPASQPDLMPVHPKDG